jgi:ribosomal protein S18 acetylase RimI-like enzyme
LLLWISSSVCYKIHSFRLQLPIDRHCTTKLTKKSNQLSSRLFTHKNVGFEIVEDNSSSNACMTQKNGKRITSNNDKSDNNKPKRRIRIRQTIESDLGAIASFLATSSIPSFENVNDSIPKNVNKNNPFWNNWKQKIDTMWAKNDIEELLRHRNRILHYGKKSYESIQKRLISDINRSNKDNNNISNDPTARRNNNMKIPGYTNQEVLQYFWYYSDSLRSMIDTAAKMTGEDNIWLHHGDMILTPTSWKWFHHLQVTAYICDETTNHQEVIVGFCEVAMLVNPAVNTMDNPNSVDGSMIIDPSFSEDDDENDASCFVWVDDVQQKQNNIKNRRIAFSPAITNLATSPSYRRNGIATYLLRLVSKYCHTYWKTQHLGLYVEKSNIPAMSLYTQLQFQPIASCNATTGRSGEMWYMSKPLVVKTNKKDHHDKKQTSKKPTIQINNGDNDPIEWNDVVVTGTMSEDTNRMVSTTSVAVNKQESDEINKEYTIELEAIDFQYNTPEKSRNSSLVEGEINVPVRRR